MTSNVGRPTSQGRYCSFALAEFRVDIPTGAFASSVFRAFVIASLVPRSPFCVDSRRFGE